jgi:hypothetical protein
MAYTDIDFPAEYFNTKLYTGNGSATHAITGVGFQPDFVWIKDRVEVYDHHLFDAVRGGGNSLYSNDTVAENTYTTDISFTSDGFTTAGVGSGAINYINQNTHTFASWNWKANGAGVSNTAGDITSTVSANTTSGFSIVSYTGNGTGGATVGHGLGVTPKMIIIKGRETTYNWVVGHNSLSTNWGKYLTLSTTDAVETATNVFNDTAPTSSLFSIGTALGVNTSSSNYIAYCFAEKKGFSKFGSYTGNGSADGTFVYTGFSPAFVMVKRTNTTSDWAIWDTARSTYNVVGHYLLPNTTGAEGNVSYIDVLSNGFKIRSSSVFNTTDDSIIYMAFAEHPFVTSTSIPTTAR